MLKHVSSSEQAREILLALLSTSGTLAGICIAMVGLIGYRRAGNIGTVADDLFLFAALGFVIVIYLIFFAMRRLESARLSFWTNVIDAMFLVSLTLLVFGGFVVVYTLF